MQTESIKRFANGAAQAEDGASARSELWKRRIAARQKVIFQDFAAGIPVAMYAVNAQGQLDYYNRQAVDLWNYEPGTEDKACSFHTRQRLYRCDGTAIQADEDPLLRVLQAAEPAVNLELIVERFDSSRVDVLMNIGPLCDSAGRVTGAVCILQDISEIKKAQREKEALLEELERSNRELALFAHAVSHDLLAPVHSIRALTQLLAKKNNNPSQEEERLTGLIEKASVTMEQLIRSLLRYAQAGQGNLLWQVVPVDSVMEEVRGSLGSLIAETGAWISCAGLPAVEGDPILLQELFQNLVANSIKYCRPEYAPVIRIRAEPDERGWRFSVKDNGQGISPEYQAIIFQPLTRLHGGDTPGSGLGLALCKTIVSRHGGRLWVESEGPGAGATFHFTLGRDPAKDH